MNFVDESGRFATLSECAFGRRGSYLVICQNPGASDHFGRSYVYLATCHGIATMTGKTRLFNLQPLYQGDRVPYAAIMRPTELILRTLYGDIRLCFAEPSLLLIRGENGLGLRFECPEPVDRMITKPRGKTAWETTFATVLNTVIHTVTGSIRADAPWNWDRLRTERNRIDLLPDEGGVMEGTLEEFPMIGSVRDSYPGYEEGLAQVTRDWETFLANIPALPGKYDALRPHAAYCLWSYLVRPYEMIRRELLFMGRFGPASQWQHTFQAVAYGHNTALGWNQLLNPFERQNENGQLPDFYDDFRSFQSTIRPPLQGWALNELRRLGYYDAIPLEERRAFYPRLAAWAEWFDKNRFSDSADGLPHYEQSDESGMEDGSTFRESCCMVTPDLSTYLILLYEALGDLAQDLGMDPAVRADWYDRAAALQARLIEKLWNGERFVSHTMEGREIERDYGILGYLPILLARRLPEDIREKLVRDLKREGYILNDYGFDKEKICARDLCDVGANSVRGYVYQPFNLLLISGLYDAGEKDFAREVARRFCDTMLEHGGIGAALNTFTAATCSDWISWTAGTYLLIAAYTA